VTVTRVDATDRQHAQAELVDAAHRIPGVAEAIELYRATSDQLPAMTIRTNMVHYATGGNE